MRARHLIAAEYSWEKITRQYEELFVETLGAGAIKSAQPEHHAKRREAA
jgi:hypothetical protein